MGVTFAVASRPMGRDLEQEILRTKRLEIVDAAGRPCVVLEAGEHGGTVKIHRPSMGDGPGELLCYIGSPFEDRIDLNLKAPSGSKSAPNSKAKLSLSIGGAFSVPYIGAAGSSGSQRFTLRGNSSPDEPMLSLWKEGEEEPYFEK
ncbi:MAG: hypothetical protein R3E96_06465 [Planctomycetota bacterium]